MVSWMSSAWAMATFVPTPSVEVARRGRRNSRSSLTSTMPAKPPTPPMTAGVMVAATEAFMSSTARSPASVSTPAEA